MLSYQHAYHAGNLADLHKHTALSVMLARMVLKPSPISYIETHAGRGLFALDAPEALKTGEAAAGLARAEAEGWFGPDHPYAQALAAARARFGPKACPGSPLVAAHGLGRLSPAGRAGDRMDLAELHPQEHAALAALMAPLCARVHRQDGFAMARALVPPEPRRGLMLIDPSYEVKDDYARIPPFLREMHRKWGVGVLALWYPLLDGAPHAPMLAALEAAGFPKALRHEIRFPPARPGHRMHGSGMFVVNAPFGLGAALDALAARLG